MFTKAVGAVAVADCDDVVLWNPAGEVTETAIANLVVEKSGLAALRRAHLRARVGRISRRIERVEMRRQEILRALKVKWLSEWDRIID
jgi:hypothetical protein